jgi:hypothetical protein
MIRFASVIVACGLLSSCKQAPSSKLNSLDNFAAGKRVRTNVCAGNPALASDVGLQEILKEVDNRVIDNDSTASIKSKNKAAVRDAFSALPPFAQSQFLALGGQILLTKDANRMCSGSVISNAQRLKRSDDELKMLREGFSEVRACFAFANPAEVAAAGLNSKSQLHLLIIVNDPTEISHNFVRVFGYMNAQLSARLAVKGDFTSGNTESVLASEYNPRFEAARTDIAKAFLADLTGRPEAKRFAKFAAMSINSPGRIVFEEYVYAEAFDSYFCNQYAQGDKNTLRVMGREFPKTLEAFTKNLTQTSRGFALNSSPSFSLWNPFGWVGSAYNSYVEKRDNMIEGMVRNVMETNGGSPPGFVDTVSIAANAAWRPVQDVPVIDSVLKPAIKYTDSIAGATINDSGDGQVLTNAQRIRLAASGTADIGMNVGVGLVAEAGGKKLGAYGAQKLGDIMFETGAGRRVVQEIAERAPSAGRVLLKYGDQAAERVVGGASEQVIDKFVGNAAADAVSGVIAGPQPSDSNDE